MKKDIAVVYNSGFDNLTHKGFNSQIYTKPVAGIKNLLQKITKLFLTPIGTDMYNPGLGTTVPALLSQGASSIKTADLEAEIINSAGQIENIIKYEQATDFTLEDSEKLKSIDLESVNIEKTGSEIYVTILVKTMENFTYFVRI